MKKVKEKKMRGKKLQVGERGKLCDLCKGQKAVIVHMTKDHSILRRHLLDMGMVKGTEIMVKKVAPLGDPIDIALRDYELCLRREEIQYIEVEVIV